MPETGVQLEEMRAGTEVHGQLFPVLSPGEGWMNHPKANFTSG